MIVALSLAVGLGLLPFGGGVRAMRPIEPWTGPSDMSAATPMDRPVSGSSVQAPASPQRLSPILARALQGRLDALRTSTAIPGVSVAIEFPDGSRWVGAAGEADLATKTPVRPETGFAVASVSKTFTAALILTLIDDGSLGLDDSVAKWLPGLELSPQITVRQLLDHPSGLRDFFMAPGIDAALQGDPDRRWDAAEALARVGKPYFKPGRSWHYSNTNYLVLGLLAERVAGRPLAAQLRERFFVPLGLEHTWYQPTEKPRTSLAHAYRMPRARPDPTAIDLSDGSAMMPFTSVVTAAAGAGGIASTAGDLVTWARALYGGELLTPRMTSEMVADAATTAALPPRVAYGLGVQVGELFGHRSLGHSGRLLGVRSVVRWLPDQRLGIAVLTNQSRTDPAAIGRAMLKVVFGPDLAAAQPTPVATSTATPGP